jgi:hypothetical protein
MIEHVVLFKLRPEADEKKIEWMLRETRMRLLKIPSVRGLRCGHRLDPALEWPFFLLVELETVEKLDAYLNDPAHVRFVNDVIKPNTSDRLVLDFRSDPGSDPFFS